MLCDYTFWYLVPGRYLQDIRVIKILQCSSSPFTWIVGSKVLCSFENLTSFSVTAKTDQVMHVVMETRFRYT